MKYVCNVCGWVYDEDETGVKWEDLPDDFKLMSLGSLCLRYDLYLCSRHLCECFFMDFDFFRLLCLRSQTDRRSFLFQNRQLFFFFVT